MMYLFFYHAKSAVIAYQAVSQVPSYVLEALFSQHMTTFTVTERTQGEHMLFPLTEVTCITITCAYSPVARIVHLDST